MNVMTEYLRELLEQDNELRKIYKRREEIAQIAKQDGYYNELWELLYKDGERHCEF